MAFTKHWFFFLFFSCPYLEITRRHLPIGPLFLILPFNYSFFWPFSFDFIIMITIITLIFLLVNSMWMVVTDYWFDLWSSWSTKECPSYFFGAFQINKIWRIEKQKGIFLMLFGCSFEETNLIRKAASLTRSLITVRSVPVTLVLFSFPVSFFLYNWFCIFSFSLCHGWY